MAAEKRPPTVMELEWKGDLRFESGGTILDGSGVAGPSPVQALGLALSSCMGADVVSILEKGRYPMRHVTITFHGDRAETEPRRFVAVSLHFRIEGEVPNDRVERAIDLSRERYCSVWHSMRQDIVFKTSYEVVSQAPQGLGAAPSGT